MYGTFSQHTKSLKERCYNLHAVFHDKDVIAGQKRKDLDISCSVS